MRAGPPAAAAASGTAGAVLGALVSALVSPSPECVIAAAAEPEERLTLFGLGVLVGVALLPVAEALLVIRRIWTAGLAATVAPRAAQVARPAALPEYRA